MEVPKPNPTIVNPKLFDASTPSSLAVASNDPRLNATTGQIDILNSTPINQTPGATDLGSAKGLTLPTPPVSKTTTNSLELANNNVFSGITTDASYESPEVSTEKKGVKDYFKTALDKITGQAKEVENLESDADLLNKKAKATAISTEIDQMDKGYRDEVAKIKLNTGGKLQGGVDAELNAAYDRYQNNRANVALTYKVAAGDYQAAQDIVDHKVTALKDQNSQTLQALQLMHSAMNDDLTESEKIKLTADYTAKANKAKTVEDAYSSVLANAAQRGAPASILSAIDIAASSPNATAATIYAAAGRYGIDPVKEAQVNSANRANQGSTPAVGDNPQLYKGLTSQTATAVRSQVGAFKTEPVVQNFQQIQGGKNFASSLDTKTTNPADDQALIYSLAKVLDPGSVVREGEYATVQKYAQSWAAAYGKGFEQAVAGTGFLSETARKNIKTTIESKYNSSLKDYQNLENEYKTTINNLTGRSDGDKFLKSYVTSSSEPQGNVVTAPDKQEYIITN